MAGERLLRDPRGEVTQQHYEVLRRERERTAQALGEHKRAFDHARAEALEYQAILAKAKRDGQQLMRILEYLDKQAA